jgi:Mg2+ and Co2+ transporter CorA
MHINIITAAGVQSRTVDELPGLLEEQNQLIWVDVPSCDGAATSVLGAVFGFHPMAIRDCVQRNRVPKVHVYADHVFVVLHSPERGRRGHVHYIELDQFVGPNYVVTVHGPLNPVVDPEAGLRETAAVLHRIQAGRLKPSTPHELSYAIVSAIARNQEAYIASLTSDVWKLEQQVTGGEIDNPQDFISDMFRARHGLLAVRTMSGLAAAIYGRIATLARLSADRLRLINDTADQFDRVRRVADGEREYLQGVIEFYQTILNLNAMLVGHAQNEEVHNLSSASYQQNEEIKKISAWAGILFAPSLVGTIYSMGFDNMPELHWRLGYPFALLLMVLSSASLYVLFKRLGWL